jgi:hypothetical protein
MNRTDYILVLAFAILSNKRGQNSKKGKGEAKPMFLKRPKNYAEFRHTDVKRHSLAPDKRFHKYLPSFCVAYPVSGTPELKFRIEKVGNGHE